MKKEMDKIQFEYRYEVQELMKVIDKYVKQNPCLLYTSPSPRD